MNGDDMCRLILSKSCDYCKLSYEETDTAIFLYSKKNKKVGIWKNKEELFNFIFTTYIIKNTNTDDTVIVVSDYLNNLK